MAYFLIGIGVGSIFATIANYKSKKHQGLLPTKYILGIGIIALVIGLLMEYQLI